MKQDKDNKEMFNLFEYKQKIDKEIQLSYTGPFDSKVLSVLGDYISEIVGKDSVAGQKFYRIFIEMAQNISFYSYEKSLTNQKIGVGTMIIREMHDKLFLHAGNMINNEDAEKIIEKCEVINSLDRTALREFKRKQRNLPPGERGTANVGLIQVALTSENPLKFETTRVDENQSFFSIIIIVNR
jgi:hypothetical protein